MIIKKQNENNKSKNPQPIFTLKITAKFSIQTKPSVPKLLFAEFGVQFAQVHSTQLQINSGAVLYKH